MQTTEVTLTIRHPNALPDDFLQNLEDFMWAHPYEFEDWIIRSKEIPRMYDMTNWKDGAKS